MEIKKTPEKENILDFFIEHSVHLFESFKLDFNKNFTKFFSDKKLDEDYYVRRQKDIKKYRTSVEEKRSEFKQYSDLFENIVAKQYSHSGFLVIEHLLENNHLYVKKINDLIQKQKTVVDRLIFQLRVGDSHYKSLEQSKVDELLVFAYNKSNDLRKILNDLFPRLEKIDATILRDLNLDADIEAFEEEKEMKRELNNSTKQLLDSLKPSNLDDLEPLNEDLLDLLEELN